MVRALPRVLLALLVALFMGFGARPAHAWIENHVLGDEVRIEVKRTGEAVVKHRLTLKTNGSIRLRSFIISGVDADATALGDAYAVPERDALSSSLENAVPLKVQRLMSSDPEKPPRLELKVDDRKGLRRGTYVLVFAYATHLMEQGGITRDGAMLRVTWRGPLYDDGFDNARAVFVVPAAATAPRAAPPEEGDLSSTFLNEVERGADQDEVSLLRTYARKNERVPWAIRVDRRALDVPIARPEPTQEAPMATPGPLMPARHRITSPSRPLWIAFAVIATVFALLAGLRRWEVDRREGVVVRPVLALPIWLSAPLAGLAVSTGLALQLHAERATHGALAIAAAVLLVAHGGARRGETGMRGPGTWLSLTEQEGLGLPPRPRGGWLDASTRVGRWLFLLVLVGHAAITTWVWRQSWLLGLQLAFDAIVWIALFGTGRASAAPPDMAVEPARWLGRFVGRLRRHKVVKRRLDKLRIVPRIRVPRGDVDPDELRLLIAPRNAPRGLGGIEVGLTYACGFGARLAMPEVLLRVQEDSPAQEALQSLASSARVVPGRRPDERVFVFSPRLPTVGMTVDIVAALLARIDDVPLSGTAGRKRPSRASRISTDAIEEADENVA